MNQLIKQRVRTFAVILVSLMMLACAHISDPHTNIPDVWQLGDLALAQELSVQTQEVDEGALNAWISPLVDTQTVALVDQLFTNSPSLKQALLQMQLAESNYKLQTNQTQPLLDLGLSKQRALSNEMHSGNYNLSLNLSWKPDIWRNLKAQTRAAQMRLMQSGISFEQTKNTQIAQLLKFWMTGIEAKQTLKIIRDRKTSVKIQSEVVTDNYVAGQGSARDVLQSRESSASIAQQESVQETALKAQMRKVLLMLGDSLSSNIEFPNTWPAAEKFGLEEVSAKYILNRDDVKRAWLELAALDSELAAAHRNRFPALNFSLNSGFKSADLEGLFNSASLFWTLFGGITQPLFDQRRLKILYEQSILKSKIQEQAYLETVQSAISEINTLRDQLMSFEKQKVFVAKRIKAAQDNEDMVIEQYLMGVAIYDSVLSAQQQLLDAKTSGVQLRSQYMQTSIDLYVALGGDFNTLSGFQKTLRPLTPNSEVIGDTSLMDIES